MNLNTEKTIAPSLRFDDYKENWKLNSLGQIAELIGGGTPDTKNKEYWGGEIQWFSPSELKQKYITKSKRTITELGLKKSSSKILPKGTILFSSRATIGEVAISLNECCTNQGFQSFILNQYNNNEFLYYWITNNRNKFLKLSSGSTFLEIGKKDIQKIKLYLPSLTEQIKIAEFLSSVDKKIQLLEKKKEQLELYKKGVMQKIFSREIRFKDENGNSFPDWEIKTMGDIIKFLSDYTANGSFGALKENVKYFSSPNYAALVRTTDLEKNFFEPKRFTDKRGYDFLKKTSLFGGEIIMANVGSIGKVYKAPNKYEGLMTLAPNTYVLKFHNNIDEEFIFQLMLRIEFKYKLLSMVGSSTLKAINKSNLRSIKIELPFYNEQKKIADFLSSIDKKIDTTSIQIDKTKEFKKGLLQQMFV